MTPLAIILGIVGVGLSFAGAVITALPFILKREIEDLTKYVQMNHVAAAIGSQPTFDGWTEHPAWKAFLTQRKYALVGLGVLAFGIAFQITSVLLQAVLG